MKQHFCYYCDKEILQKFVLVTFYVKECVNCKVAYHLNWSDVITLVTLHTTINDKKYRILHNVDANKTQITVSVGLGRKEVIRLYGDYNAITPDNLKDRLKTILTFL